jgi:hypothetical protein
LSEEFQLFYSFEEIRFQLAGDPLRDCVAAGTDTPYEHFKLY